MKKILFLMLTVTLVLTFTSFVYAEEKVTGEEILMEDSEEREVEEITLKGRLLELLTPENLSSTLGSICTVVCSAAIFVFRRIQKKDTEVNTLHIGYLKKELSAERESNKKLREDVDALIVALDNNTEILKKINLDTDENKHMLDSAKNATAATAKMVLEAFGHSRTIDSATKELITHEYLHIVNAENEDGEGESEQQNKI